jgi:hypothetical protein
MAQRLSLRIDRQEVLEGANRHQDKAKTPVQVQAHVLMDQGEMLPQRRRTRGHLASGTLNILSEISTLVTSNPVSASASAIGPVPHATSRMPPPASRARRS